MVTLNDLRQHKLNGSRFSCLTCYDASFAFAMEQAEIDCILIGDSLGMVIQGHDSTLPVSIEDMVYHTRAVRQGNQHALIMADMPFMSYSSPKQAVKNAKKLMQAGAHLVKMEGGSWLAPTIELLKNNGVPVCAHLGLTPQSVHVLGGYRLQAKQQEAANQLIQDALTLEQAGAAMILLECVPSALTKQLHSQLCVPLIGIGAGPDCDGQVLVMHDMLGLHRHKPARFVKNYLMGQDSISTAFRQFKQEVKSGEYPAPEHGFNSDLQF